MITSFYDEVIRWRDFDFLGFFDAIQKSDLESILKKDRSDPKDLLCLLSQAASETLESLAQKVSKLTRQNFGNVIHLFSPLYVSNYCENECIYCGFKHSRQVTRRKLSLKEVENEAKEIAATGIRHILLLTGESRTHSPLAYIAECVNLLKGIFASISVEIYPLFEEEYAQLIAQGVDGLTLYQETYNEELYCSLHGRGPKSDYRFRLDAPQRAATVHMRQINIGALLGLADFRKEIFFTGLHARWLERNFPEIEIGVSLPRIQPEGSAFSAAHPLTDRNLVQALFALRIFLPRAGITISTREKNSLRKNLIGLGVTRLSAGSKTEVGGYFLNEKTAGQFEVADTSSVAEVKAMIESAGYQPVFKDWQVL